MLRMATACAVALASVVLATPAAAQDYGGETGMVCGFVWNDANNNGIQDLGETGIVNKLVTLSDGTDTIEAYTDSSGFFYFYDVGIGSYTLSIETSAIAPTQSLTARSPISRKATRTITASCSMTRRRCLTGRNGSGRRSANSTQ